MSGCQESRREWAERKVRVVRGLITGGISAMVMFRLSVTILGAILFYNVPKCHHWGKLGKGYVGSLYYLLQVHVNL